MSARKQWDPQNTRHFEETLAFLQRELRAANSVVQKSDLQDRIAVLEAILPVQKKMESLMSAIAQIRAY